MVKIAVITESSTKNRNAEIIEALKGFGHELHNLGMKNEEGEPDLTYMETGFLSALLLNLEAVDFVVGGCGTGQGYMNIVLQFPKTSCGIIFDPVDAFLFSRVNAGNCVSLPLNKGYGNLAGNVNLRYIFEKLFDSSPGEGYPDARKDIQKVARKKLAKLSLQTHHTMDNIIDLIDKDIIKNTLSFPGVLDFISTAPESPLKTIVLGEV